MAITAATRTEFIIDLLEHSGKDRQDVERIGALLLRHGTTYKRYQEAWCNGVPEHEERGLERREALLETRVRALCDALGAGVRFGGDPRGATIKLLLPDGYTNDWGRTGFVVPTS